MCTRLNIHRNQVRWFINKPSITESQILVYAFTTYLQRRVTASGIQLCHVFAAQFPVYVVSSFCKPHFADEEGRWKPPITVIMCRDCSEKGTFV